MIEERRRAPRHEIDAGELAVLPVSMSVRILDISLSGVLVESRHPTKEGTRGRLRLDLGGKPFVAGIEVRRVMGAGSGPFRIGAMFVDLGPEQQQMIRHFTQQ